MFNPLNFESVLCEANKQVILQYIERYQNQSIVSRIKKKLSYFHKQLYIKYLIHRRVSKKIKTKIITGQRVSMMLPDNISASLYLSGFFEEEETKGFVELIKPNTSFVDIGAHIGYYSILTNYVGGSGTSVFSIEPTPYTFDLLTENTRGLHHGVQLNAALHSSHGTMDLNDYGIRYMSFNSFDEARLNIKLPSTKIAVKVETLDRIVKKYVLRPDLIKIDAESAEIDILKGGHETLVKFKPILFIEVGDFEILGSGSSFKIIEFLSSYCYLPYEYRKGFIPHTKHHETYPSMSLFFFHEETIGQLSNP